MDEYYFFSLTKIGLVAWECRWKKKISWGKMVLEWKEKTSLNENKAGKMLYDSVQFCLTYSNMVRK